MSNNRGIILMVFSILALVLGVSMFPYIMTYLDDLIALGLSDLLLLELVIGFAPTLLMLGIFGGAAAVFVTGYKQAAVKDAAGIIRIVIAFIGIILFVAMFGTVATVFLDLWTTYEADPNYPIFGLICGIMPTIIFLTGIAGFIGSGVSGYKASRHHKGHA
jgi:hypothetical protein